MQRRQFDALWHGLCIVNHMAKMLIIDESDDRAAELSAGLLAAGHQVTARFCAVGELAGQLTELKPEVILVAVESPSPMMLGTLSVLLRELPRPVVLLTQDGDARMIRAAFKAGVSAYVVDDLDLARLKPIVNVAIARFEEQQALKQELAEANRKLSDRIIVERAKGILMKTRGLDEDKAYEALRSLSMERAQPMAKVANDLVTMAKLLL
jgi:response regulator NasT